MAGIVMLPLAAFGGCASLTPVGAIVHFYKNRFGKVETRMQWMILALFAAVSIVYHGVATFMLFTFPPTGFITNWNPTYDDLYGLLAPYLFKLLVSYNAMAVCLFPSAP